MSFQIKYSDVHGRQYQIDKEMGLIHNDLLEQYPKIDITNKTWQEAMVIVQNIPQPERFLTNPSLPKFRFQRIYFYGNNLPVGAPTTNTMTCEYAIDRISIELDDNNLVTQNTIA